MCHLLGGEAVVLQQAAQGLASPEGLGHEQDAARIASQVVEQCPVGRLGPIVDRQFRRSQGVKGSQGLILTCYSTKVTFFVSFER